MPITLVSGPFSQRPSELEGYAGFDPLVMRLDGRTSERAGAAQ
jgi:hypothetical protein